MLCLCTQIPAPLQFHVVLEGQGNFATVWNVIYSISLLHGALVRFLMGQQAASLLLSV